MNVFPRPQELYTYEHKPYKEGMYQDLVYHSNTLSMS